MIRRITKDDLESVIALENRCFPDDPWPESEFLYELNENPFSQLYLYEENGRILGYIDFWILYDKAQLANIAVDPDCRRQGIGRKLMDFCIHSANQAGCETLSLEARLSNEAALAMYHSYGFIDAAIRKHYYEDGEDATLMVLPLGGEDDTDTCN